MSSASEWDQHPDKDLDTRKRAAAGVTSAASTIAHDKLPDALWTFSDQVERECTLIALMLKAKNVAYGNSALDPVRIFSRSDALEQINVRIDDKLSRLMRGQDAGEDTEQDLIGYLILRRIARRMPKP